MAYTNNYNSKRNQSAANKTERTYTRWTDVFGEITIWGYEKTSKSGENYFTYTTAISRKNDDGKWESVWVDVVFSREANPEMSGRFDTTIKSGFWSLRVWDDKDGHHVKPCVVITDHQITD